MKNNMKKTLALLLSVSVLAGNVTSCANMSDGTKTRYQGLGIGALGGAAVGAGIGQLAGRDSKSTLIGAGIGAAVGSVAGWFWGNSVALQKEQYASVEEQIKDSNRAMDQLIAQTKKDNAALKNAIANLRKENKKLASSAKVKADAKKLSLAVDDSISILNNEVVLARRAAGKASGKERIVLNGKISTLNSEISSLKTHKRELAALSK